MGLLIVSAAVLGITTFGQAEAEPTLEELSVKQIVTSENWQIQPDSHTTTNKEFQVQTVITYDCLESVLPCSAVINKNINRGEDFTVRTLIDKTPFTPIGEPKIKFKHTITALKSGLGNVVTIHSGSYLDYSAGMSQGCDMKQYSATYANGQTRTYSYCILDGFEHGDRAIANLRIL